MQIPVLMRPTNLFQANSLAEDITLFNPTTAPIYLDTRQGVSATASQPLNPQAQVVWQKGRELWALATAQGASLLVLENAGATSDPNAIAVALITAGLAQDIADAIHGTGVPITNSPDVSLAPGASVGIVGTPNVAVPGGVGIVGTPDVAVPGGVGINGTPNVTIPAGAAGTSQGAAPDLAYRNVSADTAASASISGSGVAANGTTTLAASPGSGKIIELHNLNVSLSMSNTTTNNATTYVCSVQDSTGVVLFVCSTIAAPNGGTGSTDVTFDFQGARIVANRGLRFVTTGASTGTARADVTVTYSVVV